MGKIIPWIGENMSDIDRIDKNNPVYLYKIIKQSGKNKKTAGTYKAFMVFKAWDKPNSTIAQGFDISGDSRAFSYYANGHLRHETNVSVNPGVPYSSASEFNIWFKERNDILAIEACKEWLYAQNKIKKDSVRSMAYTLMDNQDFAAMLRVTDYDV